MADRVRPITTAQPESLNSHCLAEERAKHAMPAEPATIPPGSNTGVSSAEGAQARVSAGATRTIIDTLSLVFPLLSIVPDYEAADVSVDKAPGPREALKLPQDQQVERALDWWYATGGAGKPIPVTEVLVEQWVNQLWRLSVVGKPDAQGRAASEQCVDDVMAAFDMLLGAMGFALSPRPAGRNGFTYSANIVPSEWNYYRDGAPPSMGHVAWGGIKNKQAEPLAQLHLTGQGCEMVAMGDAWPVVHGFAVDHGAHISRIDIALDDFAGEHGDTADWFERYQAGDFAIRQNPSHTWITGDTGETLYIGSRASGKMCRIYAKGQQLGDADSPWVRIEVELRNAQREIPLAAIVWPDSYFAGCYPALEDLEVSTCADLIPTIIKNTAAATVGNLIHHASRSYGKLLDVLARLGLSDAEIVQRLRVDGVPARLARASFLYSQASVDEQLQEARRKQAGPEGDYSLPLSEAA